MNAITQNTGQQDVEFFLKAYGFYADMQLAQILGQGEATIKIWRREGIPQNKKLLLKLLAEDYKRKKAVHAKDTRQYLDEARKVLSLAMAAKKDDLPSIHDIKPIAISYTNTHAERLGLDTDSKKASVAQGLMEGAQGLLTVYLKAKLDFRWPPADLY